MGDDSWVFDSLVGFLKGPVWNVPILTFIEHKSLIFEADSNYEDSSMDYKKIHDEYKNLVDFMLGSYMEDIGITPEQFESACGKASKNIKSKFHQSLFEQVWAADDFDIFKGMMIQKNIELQLQALEILQHRYGLVPQSFVADGALPPDENAIMEQVLKKSLEEHEALQALLDDETRALEKTIAVSAADKERLEKEKWQEHVKLQRALNMPEPEAEAMPEAPAAEEISAEDLERRKEYLKAQRDKLLAMKQEERLKQLKEYEASSSTGRPKSSYAAKTALSGSRIDAQTLEVRKALAARLKEEVIGE
ncbi:cilia- and flagella-associated protein 36 [Hyalella azteca]|uniref:Cilia- and flagella-associated protein 36 n=1 Tax=Hyalella azteca TaxID=294128 RepID=A0A8B7N4S0_HYAAZ|nr:cilia- and flagella-associated protein 36 [Hyalella azteca]